MRGNLKERVHRVWLAGLGAMVAAEREGGELFSRLVREGERWERDLAAASPSDAGHEFQEHERGPARSEEEEILAGAGLLLERIAEQRSQVLQMIDAMMPAAVPSTASVLQARRNAAARASLLEEFGALSSQEVADLAGSRATNRAALANRWKQEGRIFGVSVQGETRFPAFQFDSEGRPLGVVAEVIKALSKSQTEWQLALWFTRANGWLGGRRAVDLLESDPEAVKEAAWQEGAGLDF